MYIKMLLAGILFTLLTGCATTSGPFDNAKSGDVILDNVSITISFDDAPIWDGLIYRGVATWGPGWCNIILKTGDYPGCLMHEVIVHCIERRTHILPSSEYCEQAPK